MESGKKLAFGMPMLLELGSIRNNAAFCRRLGLDFLELNMNLPVCQLEKLGKVQNLREIAEKYGIYYTLHLDENLNVSDFNESVAAVYRDVVNSAVLLAKNLNVPTLTMHMNPGVYYTMPEKRVYLFEQYKDVYKEKIKIFRDMCEKTADGDDIHVCVENTSGFTDFQKEAVALLLESGTFGLTFDVGHCHTMGNADEKFILDRKEKLRHFHLHDAAGIKDHLALGDGEINLTERMVLAAERDCRCLIEVKTMAALEKSVKWLSDRRYLNSPPYTDA